MKYKLLALLLLAAPAIPTCTPDPIEISENDTSASNDNKDDSGNTVDEYEDTTIIVSFD